jgi:hypothetical protein
MPAMPSRLARYCTLVFSAPPDAVEFTAANLETHVEGGVVQIAGVQPAVLAAVVCGELTPYDFGARCHSQVVREVCREPSCKHAKPRLGWTRARQVSKP